MDNLYAQFMHSYVVVPVYYRLGDNYTITDIVVLLAKQHTIALTGVVITIVNTKTGIVSYGTKSISARVIDILYIIDRLLANKYKLVETAPELLTIPPELQDLIYRASKSTGKIAHLSKATNKVTTQYIPELCKEPITPHEIKLYVLEEISNSFYSSMPIIEGTLKPVITASVARYGIVSIQSRTKRDAKDNKFFLYRSVADVSLVTAAIQERYKSSSVMPLDEAIPTFYNEIEDVEYIGQIHILEQRTQCVNADRDYPMTHVANSIENNWSKVDTKSLLQLRLFYYRGNLQHLVQQLDIVQNQTDQRIKLAHRSSVLTDTIGDAFTTNGGTIEQILPLLTEYVQVVLEYLRL